MMKKYIVVVLTVASLILFANVRSQSNEELWKEGSLSCQDGLFQTNDFFKPRLGACFSFYGPGKQNPDCIYFCLAKGFGLLNENGVPTMDIYDRWVETTFSKNYQEFTKTWIKDCWEKFGNKIELEDPTCKMANEYNKCTWNVQPNLKC